METIVMNLNQWGDRLVGHAGAMLVQASLLIALLWLLDCILYRHLRASLRYGLWMLVLVKLLVSPQWSLPTGIGHWINPPTSLALSVLSPPESSPAQAPPSVIAPASTEEQALDVPAKDILQQAAIPTDRHTVLTLHGRFGLGWLIMCGVLLLGLIVRTFSLARILHRSQTATAELCTCLDRAQREVALAGHVELRLTDELSSPVVCRVWKPVILMPQHLADTLPEEKQRAILIHELCHIKRLDPWVNLAQTLLQVIYLYHPLVWWANTCIRRVREQAVDEMALVYLKDQRQCYSHTLIDVAQAMALRTHFGMGLIGVSETKTQLNERIKLMLYRPISKHAGLNLWGLLAILATGSILLPMSPGHRVTAAEVPGFTASSQQEQSELITQIQDTESDMITAFNEGHLEDSLQGYCDDVIQLSPGFTARIGKDSAKADRQISMAQGIQISSLTKRDQQIWVSGDLIYAIGPYAMTLETPDAHLVTQFRNAITIWQRQANGSLQVKIEAFNMSTTPGNPMTYGDLSDNILELQCCTEDCDTLPDGHPLYQTIRDLEEEFHRLFYTGQRMKSLDYYTENLQLCCTGSELLRGKPAMRDMLIKTAEQDNLVNLDVKTIEVQGNEHLIYAVNLFNWTMENQVSGQNFTIPGKGIHVWQKQADGSWKILYDLNSPDLKL